MSMLANAARGIKNMWGHGDDDYEGDEDELFDTDESTTSSKYSTDKYSPDKYSSDKQPSEKYSPGYGSGGGTSSRVRSLRSVPIPLRAREKNIYTLRPKNQDEAAIAADYLKSGSAVVMNLETVESSVALRIIDFMSGVCYGLEGQGHAMKLGGGIFLFTPAEFEISSDELDYGENRDFFFKDVQSAPAQQVAPGPNRSVMSTPPAGHMPSAVPHTMPSSTPSGYATANYAAPATSAMRTPAPVAGEPERVPVQSEPPVVRASTLPATSVYGSGGKAHMTVASRATAAAPSTQGSFHSHSWDR